MTKPIFILSTPRTGSTLLQRILASHSNVTTTPEPHLLLPLIYAFKKEGLFAHYHQTYAVKGLTEFFEYLPENKKSYLNEVRNFAESLYQKVAKDYPYFIDKTPAYSLISKEMLETFPDAKFIILVRNPISSIASAIQLFGLGKWRLFPVHDVMVLGLKNILEVVDQYKDKICLVNFERLVNDTEQQIKKITDYLGLEYDPEMVLSFNKISFRGKMGDSNAGKYLNVSNEPVEKWKKIMNSPLRKIWIKNYLQSLGKNQLKAVGYDSDKLLCELYRLPNDYIKLVQDIFEMSRDILKIKLKKLIFKRTINIL